MYQDAGLDEDLGFEVGGAKDVSNFRYIVARISK
jgi:hypothetical protein